METQGKEPQKYLTVRVDEDLDARLAELAKRNERSKGAEARVAIRSHVDSVRVPARPEVNSGGE